MGLLRSDVLIFFFILVAAESKPQAGPGNSIAQDGPKVIIEENGNSVPEIDYDRLGEYKVCGFSSKNLSSIARTGGGVARLRDWPWMAAMVRKLDKFHFCGGALITPKHVLTAAHCVEKLEAKDIFIRLGEYDFTRDNDSRINDFDIKEIRVHQEWDPSTYENDISILHLVKFASYDIYTQPICLPLPMQDFTNTTAVVAGWGTTQFGGPMSDLLLEVPVPVWEQEKCVQSFTQTIFDTVQCAAGYEGGRDSCQGDSGGPLMSQRKDGRWITIGIVSWGIGCGNQNQPGVYTRVNRYLNWIAENIIDMM